MSEYPEHEKLQAVATESQTVGEFLDWLDGQGIQLMHYQEANGEPRWIRASTGEPVPINSWFDDDVVENPDYVPAGWYGDHVSIQDRLADFFDIDRDEIEKEKRAMLASIRS